MKRIFIASAEFGLDRADTIFLDQQTDGLVRGHVLACGIIVTPADQLAARTPEVIVTAVQLFGRKICRKQPLQEP